jgi:hypothetical protein
MAGEQPTTGPVGWALYLLVAVAVGVAVGLQLLVAETIPLERAVTIALLLAGMVFMSWSFFGGMSAWVARREENRLRRHIRYHPLIVDDLRSLVALVEDTLGGGGQSYRQAANNLLQAWLSMQQQDRAPGSGAPFTSGEIQQFEMAHAAWADSSYITVMWPTVRNTVYWMTDGPNRRDSHAFSFAAFLLQGYVSGCLSNIDKFVLGMQQGGVSKLNPVTLGQWEQFARKVNAMIDEAERISRRAPSEAGVGITLTFTRVVEHFTTR